MFEIDRCGTKFYRNDHGQLHREDGPAVEYANGTKFWFFNGNRHHEDGPAVERANGEKRWCINGKLHREDGPAIEYANGSKLWYINDILCDLKNYHKKMLERSNNHV